MKKKKSVEGALAALASAEIQEVAPADLEGVVAGTTTFTRPNGNCSCAPGTAVPPGSWLNGNCTRPLVVQTGEEER